MYVLVDVDGTLIDAEDVTRPHVLTFFWQVSSIPDVKVVVWSAGGRTYAERKVEMMASRFMRKALTEEAAKEVDIRTMIHDYSWKRDWKKVWEEVGSPLFFVDDSKQLIDAVIEKGHCGYTVPYFNDKLAFAQSENSDLVVPEAKESYNDEWLLVAADRIEEWATHTGKDKNDGGANS